MKYLLLIFISCFFIGCASKELNTNKANYKLNFVNKTGSHIENVYLFSKESNKKLYFNIIPKNSYNSYVLFKEIKNKNKIKLSWKHKNKVYEYEFKIATKKNHKSDKNSINFNFLSDGKFYISLS
jgi:hypothetical protein